MTSQEKWDYIVQLDEELLKGGVLLSEWTTFLAKDAEVAYCNGAPLSSILASQAAIECHLRYDLSIHSAKRLSFYDLIEQSNLDEDVRSELHVLRKFRNRWVHVNDPFEDNDLLDRPEYFETELEEFAQKTIRTMLMVLYSDPLL